MQNSVSIAPWIDVANLPEEMEELRNGPCHSYVESYWSPQCRNPAIIP